MTNRNEYGVNAKDQSDNKILINKYTNNITNNQILEEGSDFSNNLFNWGTNFISNRSLPLITNHSYLEQRVVGITKEALNNVYRVGVVHSSGIGGYISNNARAKTTLRQMVHVFRLSGIGKYLNNHRLYAAEYNAETKPGREILDQGRKPTTRKQDMPIGKDDTNFRKKNFINSARPQHGVKPLVARTKFKQRVSTRPVENKRNDLTLISRQLKNNVFVIKR